MFHESALTEEQQLIRSFTKQLAKDYDNSYFLARVRANEFPQAFWDVLAKNGFLSLEAPEDHGGGTFQLADLVVLMYGLGAGGLVSYHLMDQLLAGHALSSFGDAAQKKAYWPGLIEGKRWAAATLEDTTGRDEFACATTAKLEGDSYVLKGKKRYVACAGEVERMLVTARIGKRNAADPAAGIGLFVVEAKAPGVKVKEREINVRVAETREARSIPGDVFFDVKLASGAAPAAARGGAADGAAAKSLFTRGMLMLAAAAVGWGDRVIDKAVDYANQRVLYTQPISSYQAIQHPMVRAKTEVEMAKLLIERAVEAEAETQDVNDRFSYASIAKYMASEGAFLAFDIGIQAHGGSAFDRETGVITLWPLVLMSRMIPLNSDVILERFGDRLLGVT